MNGFYEFNEIMFIFYIYPLNF